jgi:hypothetical protein
VWQPFVTLARASPVLFSSHFHTGFSRMPACRFAPAAHPSPTNSAPRPGPRRLLYDSHGREPGAASIRAAATHQPPLLGAETHAVKTLCTAEADLLGQ